MKTVLKMSNLTAKKYFMKSNSYFTLELPLYFNFTKLLDNVEEKLKGHHLSDYYNEGTKPCYLEDVNYKFLHNKDGKYSWRPIEIIHPAIYVELVNILTDRENWKILKKKFMEFQENKKIVCCSIPCESVSKRNDKKSIIINWWDKFEQESISLALEYDYCAQTDISNCYSSIYTHSIAWAIHTKDIAKQNQKSSSMLGNKIDKILQLMSYNQTNGIPQGSVVMDFIAEIVLGYTDTLITEKLRNFNISEYKILRYRDDYRIFANDTTTLDKILKIITEVLSMLNFKLNNQKTVISDDIINSSIKKDKIYWLNNKYNDKISIQKKLVAIKNLGKEFPNCGTITKELMKLYKSKIIILKRKPNDLMQIISIVVDIMLRNPRTYDVCSAILSKLLAYEDENFAIEILKKIKLKFSKIPNTEYLDLWLQRISVSFDRTSVYETKLCQKIYSNNNIWDSSWLKFEIDEKLIIDNKELENIPKIIQIDEVDLFNKEYY